MKRKDGPNSYTDGGVVGRGDSQNQHEKKI